MTEVAGRWVAVSTKAQDEREQEPDIDRWVAGHGYSEGPTYRLHGVSRYKGAKRHDDELDRVIEDMKLGKINVLIVWQSSRIERRGAYNVFDLARRVKEAGGRIEYVKDVHLNATNEMSDVMLALNATTDHLSSKAKSDAVIKSRDARREAGALWGRASFGYTSAIRADGFKGLVPTDIGRKYVPAIFAKVANGSSLIEIAHWLDEERVPVNSKAGAEWSTKSLSQIIRNAVYTGTQKDSHGEIIHTCEALVSDRLFEQANKALDASPRGTRGPRTKAPAMLSGALECGSCGGSMYRIMSGYNASRRAYYRCAGKGTKPKGCGAPMITVEALDAKVTEIISLDTREITETRFVPGTDKEGKLASLKKAIRDLDMDADNYDDEYSRLMGERKTLMASDMVPDRWLQVPSGETYASRWSSSDDAGRRAMLKHDARVIVTWSAEDKANGIQPSVFIKGAGFEVPSGFKVLSDGSWVMQS